MMICRIEGSMHSTVQDPPLDGKKLLLARPLDLEGRPKTTPPLVAVDHVDAGEGDLVLVMKEGGSARLVLEDDRIAAQAVVVAVIDDLALED